MPTHTYLRYSQDAAWGVICSGGGQVAVDTTGKLALAPALEAVAVWNVKTGALVQALRASTATPSEVTALELGSDGDTLAVGHADGSIRLWQLAEGNERLTLNGHKGAVNALRLNRSATLLVSGGRDTALVLWDVIAERGICRLRGHRDAVTDMCLLEAHHALASVSKDGTLRLWDLHTQHCVQNVTVPSGEAWSVDCDASCERLLTGGAKAELLAWRIETRQLAAEQPAAPTIAIATTAAASGGGGESGGESGGSARAGEWRGVHAVQLGPLGVRASVSRVVRLRFGLDDAVVAVQFADRNLVLYSVQSSAQLKRQLKRRQAKRRKQLDGTDGPPLDDGGTDAASSLSAADSYLPLCHLRGAHKLHSFAFLPRQKAAAAAAAAVGDGGDGASSSRKEALTARLLIADRSNTLAVHACELRQGGTTSVVGSVSLCGHRAEPRSIALSTDDRTLLSASDGEAKVWNVKSQQCTGTLGCGYGLSVVFLLASKYAVVGTKAGLLQVFSLASTEMVAEVEAHAGAIWSLAVQPGTTTLLSASADKTLATWTPLEAGPTQISLGEEMRHEAGDDVLCARYTPNAKQVVAALLDGSIQVLFSDSFSLALTLYGHKLPALCVSVASDNAIAVSGSADKTIKIWGLDFGDCHRSLYGHSESVMSVAFVRETHYFFSSSKDHTIRYWDADRFEHILTMRGHHAEVWCIVPARTGAFLASASKDRSLRVWRRGDEQVFVEEEREAELEQVFEAGFEKRQEAEEAEEEEAAALGIEGGIAESGSATRRTMESVKGAERVLEALKVLDEEAERVAEHAAALKQWEARNPPASTDEAGGSKPPVLVPNMLLLGMRETDYLLKALTSVRTTELEQALLLIPFDVACGLLRRLQPLIATELPIELIARCVLFVVRVHNKQMLANGALMPLLHQIDAAVRTRLLEEQSMVGYNLAAMRFMQQSLEQKASAKFFEAALEAKADAGPSVSELRRKTAARVRGTKKEKPKRKQPATA